MDNTETDIPLFDKAVKKFNSCKQMNEFMGQKTCTIFHKKIDSSIDILNYCGSCFFNTKEPSSVKVRSRI